MQQVSAEPTSGLVHGCLICGFAFASRQQWGAHAQKAHGYRKAATQYATGRTCRACGSQYANKSHLRCHLLASARCLEFLEAAGSPAMAPAAEDGHTQAPVVRGWGTSHLRDARPATCNALYDALARLTDASDQQIYDVVAQYVAPLPLLRQTVCTWRNALPVGALREAAEDVLLVLISELVHTHCWSWS